MTLREIINAARVYLDDTRPPYLWEDTELTRWINEVEDEICEETGALRDSSTLAITQITVAPSTSLYTLHAKVIKIIKAKLGSTYKELEYITAEFLDDNYPGWEDDTGTPTNYLLSDTGKLRVYPTPPSTYTNTTLYLRVTRYPTTALTLASDTTSPEIPLKYHRRMVTGVLARAYLKDDAETQDLKKASLYDTRWKQELSDMMMVESKYYEHGTVVAPLFGAI